MALITVNQSEGDAAEGPGRVPRGRWPRTRPAADPPQLGAAPTTRPSPSPTTSGAATSSARRSCWDLETVEAFDVISEHVSPEQVKQSVRVSSDLGQHAAWLQEYIDQGWDELYLHFVGQEQARFIDAFGEHVLPQLSPTAAPAKRLA